MLTLIGLLLIELTVQSIAGEVGQEYKLQLSYHERKKELTFDLRSAMSNKFEVMFYYVRSRMEQTIFSIKVDQGSDRSFVNQNDYIYLQQYQAHQSNTVEKELMILRDLNQYGFVRLRVDSNTIPHDMYSEYNLQVKFDFVIYPLIQSMNQKQYDLHKLVQSENRHNYFYLLLNHNQNNQLFKYQLNYELNFANDKHQGLQVTFYKYNKQQVDFSELSYHSEHQKKVFAVPSGSKQVSFSFLFIDFFGYYDVNELQKNQYLLMEVKANKGKELSQSIVFKMSKTYIEMSEKAQQFATFIPLAIIAGVVVIISLYSFYKRHKGDRRKELLKELQEKRDRKQKLQQLIDEKKQKEKMRQGGQQVNKKYTKKVIIRKHKQKKDSDNENNDENDSTDQLSYDSELSENANRIHQDLQKKSRLKKNRVKKTIKVQINSKSKKSRIRLFSDNFLLSFKKRFKIYLEKTRIKLKQKWAEFQEWRKTRKTKDMNCLECLKRCFKSRKGKDVYKENNSSQIHLKQQDQSSFNAKSDYNLDESAINDDKVKTIQFESNHYNSVTKSNKTNDKLDIESNKDSSKKYFFF